VIRAGLRLLLAVQCVRHAVVLANIAASQRFLRQDEPRATGAYGDVPIAVVLPLLREQSTIREAVAHFRSMLREEDLLMLVTTARETARAGAATGTPALAAALADGERVRHLHLEDPEGRKGDQINLAAAALRLAGGDTDDRRLVVIYDADSRPPRDSLRAFAEAASAHPRVDVYHQSALFEVRAVDLSRWERAVAHAGALRANRFVLAYEVPRLRSRSPHAGVLRSRAAQLTYGHVSGHGLGVRLAFLLERPMPVGTLMEDMHYSFELAVDGIPVVPLASLDRSEVPGSWRQQFRQAERWFAGPGRAIAYARQRRAEGGAAGGAITASAFLISLEWLSCAVALPVLLGGLRCRGPDRGLAGTFLGLYLAELVLAGRGRPAGGRSDQIAGLLAFPLVNTGFGLAGWSALAGRMLGRQAREKTER
jgi:hypothetical protein